MNLPQFIQKPEQKIRRKKTTQLEIIFKSLLTRINQGIPEIQRTIRQGTVRRAVGDQRAAQVQKAGRQQAAGQAVQLPAALIPPPDRGTIKR